MNTRYEAINKLINALFINGEVQQNESIALNFIFPDLLLQAIALIDTNTLKHYTLNDASLFLIKDRYIDLRDWWCPCIETSDYIVCEKFENKSGFGQRVNTSLQFDEVPVCEHLLALCIAERHGLVKKEEVDEEKWLELHAKLY